MKTTFPVLSKMYPMESFITAVSKDKNKAYFVTRDGKVKAIDIKTGKELNEKNLGKIPSSGKYISGKLYIGTQDGSVIVLNTADGSVEKIQKLHNGKITDIQPSKDKELIITASIDGNVKINKPDLSTIKTLKIGGEIYSANISPRKEKLAVGKGDKSVDVIDLKTGKMAYRIEGLRAVPISLAFANEEVLITASSIKDPDINIFRNGHLMKKWLQTIK